MLAPPVKSVPELCAVILAGGASTRMGHDKGVVDYHGQPQAVFLAGLLARCCERVLVSVNATQVRREPYVNMDLVIDESPRHGPATGLLAAYRRYPRAAWLAVAVDLARLDEQTIDLLIKSRHPDAAATAFEHPDGTIEPLCTIWEPKALFLLAEQTRRGKFSPRRSLEMSETHRVRCPDPKVIRSVDTAEERDALLVEQ